MPCACVYVCVWRFVCYALLSRAQPTCSSNKQYSEYLFIYTTCTMLIMPSVGVFRFGHLSRRSTYANPIPMNEFYPNDSVSSEYIEFESYGRHLAAALAIRISKKLPLRRLWFEHRIEILSTNINQIKWPGKKPFNGISKTDALLETSKPLETFQIPHGQTKHSIPNQFTSYRKHTTNKSDNGRPLYR